MSRAAHATVVLELHVEDVAEPKGEDVIRVELQFHLPPITGEQFPFVAALTLEMAHAQMALIRTLVKKGLLAPMTSEEKVEALRKRARDQAN